MIGDAVMAMVRIRAINERLRRGSEVHDGTDDHGPKRDARDPAEFHGETLWAYLQHSFAIDMPQLPPVSEMERSAQCDLRLDRDFWSGPSGRFVSVCWRLSAWRFNMSTCGSALLQNSSHLEELTARRALRASGF
jgi:hypothetical protein